MRLEVTGDGSKKYSSSEHCTTNIKAIITNKIIVELNKINKLRLKYAPYSMILRQEAPSKRKLLSYSILLYLVQPEELNLL